MKIALLIFSDFPEGSGPARRLHMIGKGFARLGHEVHVVVPQRFDTGPLNEEFDGLDVHWGALTDRSAWSKPSSRLAARRASLRLVNRLTKEGLDWLLLSNPGLDGIPFLLAARRSGARVMATYDDLRHMPQQPSLEDRIRLQWLRAADSLIPRLTQLNIAQSSYLADRVRSIAPRTQVCVLPPLVDLDLFRPLPTEASEFRIKWGLAGTTVISYLGTYWHVDGVKNLLLAAGQLAQAGGDFKVVISGAARRGLDCVDVSDVINRLDLHSFIVETGWLLTQEVVAAMSAADILVAPKLDHIANVAGVPAKLAEYLAVERAVVVSRVGDIPLYVTDREDALLCEPGDPESLAGALQLLMDDVTLREKLASKARRTARERFDYQEAIRQLEVIMAQVSR
jgi:glycosyltransferase involved in cell wall biosynthesis